MLEIIALIYMLLNGGYVLYAYSRRASSENDFMVIIGNPIGQIIPQKVFDRMTTKSNHQKLNQLYSSQEYETGLFNFQCGRIGLVYLMFVIGGFLAITLGESYMPSSELSHKIDRPAYGEGDVALNIAYEVSNGDKPVSGQMPLVVEEQLPDKTTALEVLNGKADILGQIIRGQNQDNDHIYFDLNVQKAPFEEAITISYVTLTPDVINNKGQIRRNLMNYDEPYNISIEATMSYGDVLMVQTYAYIAYKNIPAALDEAGGVEAQILVEEAHVMLPESTQIGFRDISWKTVEEGISVGQIILLTLLLSTLFYIVKEQELNKKIINRQDEILFDFPNVVNKLTILINAGMTFGRAWHKIVVDYQATSAKKRVLYEEMVQVSKDIQMGVSEMDAIEAFGKRCRSIEVIRLSSILIQNLRRGSHSLTIALKALSIEAWSIRTSNARKLGEKASTKLLIPMAISLLTVLLIVIAPTFMKMTL